MKTIRTFNIDVINLIGKLNNEIDDAYDTCVSWIEEYVNMTSDSKVFRVKAEKEIDDFLFYCDGMIRTLELMNIDVTVQRKLVGNLKERAEKHILKYM